MKYSPEKIGNIIKNERLKLNWSQETLAKELGQKSNGKQISKYESGTFPPISTLLKLCEIFNCELGYLLGEQDYSSKTKIDTAIEKTLGFNEESIKAIKHITGNDRKCLHLGCESTKYRHILNDFVSLPECSDLFEALFYLDSMVEEKEILYSKLEQKYGKEVIDKAFEYYSSSTDYFNDKNAEKLPSIFYEALFDIDTLISSLPDISYSIKVARYEVREAFERLIDALYPKKQ